MGANKGDEVFINEIKAGNQAAFEAMVLKYQPKLTDAYLSDLYGAFSNQIPDSGIIPIAYLKERLNIMVHQPIFSISKDFIE